MSGGARRRPAARSTPAALPAPRRRQADPAPSECWAVLRHSCGFLGPHWAHLQQGSSSASAPATVSDGGVAYLDTEGNEHGDWAAGAEPTLLQVAFDGAVGGVGGRHVLLYAPAADRHWRERVGQLLAGVTVTTAPMPRHGGPHIEGRAVAGVRVGESRGPRAPVGYKAAAAQHRPGTAAHGARPPGSGAARCLRRRGAAHDQGVV